LLFVAILQDGPLIILLKRIQQVFKGIIHDLSSLNPVHLQEFWLFSITLISITENEDKEITGRILWTTHDKVGVLLTFVVNEIRRWRQSQIITDPLIIELWDIVSHRLLRLYH